MNNTFLFSFPFVVDIFLSGPNSSIFMSYKRKLSTKFSKPSYFRKISSLLDFLILNLRVTRFPLMNCLLKPKLPKTTLTFRAVVFVPHIRHVIYCLISHRVCIQHIKGNYQTLVLKIEIISFRPSHVIWNIQPRKHIKRYFNSKYKQKLELTLINWLLFTRQVNSISAIFMTRFL